MGNFWKEEIDLGTATNIDYRRLSIYDMSIEKEGLQTMAEYAQKVFTKYGLPLPITFVHPGGRHPYLTSEVLKNALDPFGFKGGASYPFEKIGISYYNPKGIKQFQLQGGDISPENQTLTEINAYIAEFFAKNNILVSINHLNYFGAGNSLDQMQLGWNKWSYGVKTIIYPLKLTKIGFRLSQTLILIKPLMSFLPCKMILIKMAYQMV